MAQQKRVATHLWCKLWEWWARCHLAAAAAARAPPAAGGLRRSAGSEAQEAHPGEVLVAEAPLPLEECGRLLLLRAHEHGLRLEEAVDLLRALLAARVEGRVDILAVRLDAPEVVLFLLELLV